MYALGAVLASFSSWALLRALFAGKPRLWHWLLYWLLALCFAYTHYYALFTLVTHAAFVVAYIPMMCSRCRVPLLHNAHVKNSTIAAGLLIVGCLPWFRVFVEQRARVQREFWIQPVELLDIARVWYQMMVEPLDSTADVGATVLVISLCAIVLIALLWRATSKDWFIFVSVLCPFVLSLGVSWYDTNVFYVRYFIFAHLFFLIAIARIVQKLPSMMRPVVAICVVANFVAVQYFFLEKLESGKRPGMTAAVKVVASNRKVDEPVVVWSPHYFLSALYHSRGRFGVFLCGDRQDIAHYDGAAALLPGDLVSREELSNIAADRLWVISAAGHVWDPHNALESEGWRIERIWRYPEAYEFQGTVVVELYRRIK